MSRGSSLDKLQRKAVIRLLQHVERLAEAEITQDIHRQVTRPVAHVPRLCPSFLLRAAAASDLLAERSHVGDDVALHLLGRALGEGMGQDAALARVQLLVAAVVRVGGRVHEGVVELGLADVGAEAVDLLEGRVGVE